MKNLTIQEQDKSLQITNEKLIGYLDTIGVTGKLNDSQKEQFIEIAQSFKLNPFKREIHAVVYTDKNNRQTLSVITGYEVYIKRAERSGNLDGWKAWTRKDGDKLEDLVGCIEIYRKDWSKPFYHEVYFPEVANKNQYGYTSFWKKAPRFQLKKVAISQGFRLCFPDELAGMPYTNDELPDNMAGRDVTPYDEDYNNDVKTTHVHNKEESLIDNESVNLKKGTKKLNVNDLSQENQDIYRDIMKLINSKDSNKKDVFNMNDKIAHKKSADAVMSDIQALSELHNAIENIVNNQ